MNESLKFLMASIEHIRRLLQLRTGRTG